MTLAARYFRGLTLAVVGLLCGLHAVSLWRAPSAWLPQTISIRLAPGEAVALGRAELAAPQADKVHLSLQREAGSGAWSIRNLSPTRQVALLRDGHEQRMGSAPLRSGQRFQVGGSLFEVLAADRHSVRFSRNGQQWRYDGAVLYRDGVAQGSCPGSHLASRASALWNRWLPAPLQIARPATLGGNLLCDNRLGLDGVGAGSAQLTRSDGQLQLAAATPDGERAAVTLFEPGSGTAARIDLRRQQTALAGLSAIIVGHTRFQLALQADQLLLTPSRHITLFSAPDQKLPQQLSWTWRQREHWRSPASTDSALWAALAAGLLAVLVMNGCQACAAHPHATRAATLAALLAAACVLLCGVGALLLQRNGTPPPAAASMALACLTLWLWLTLPGRLPLLTAAAAVLLAAGLLAQLELGLGAPEVSWLRYYQKSCAMLAIGAGLGAALRVGWRQQLLRSSHLGQRGVELALALLAAVALAALAAQVLWGDETGVFELQPVELAKLALTALTAHCLALRLGWRSGSRPLAAHGLRWLQVIAPALLFVALLGLALVQVDDFSPLILLLVWSAGMAMAYALASGNRALALLLLTVGLAAIAAVAWLRLQGSDDLIRWGFYADRFLVWLHPGEHPHTGQQLLLGAQAIAEGGWLGGDQALGLRSLGLAAGSAALIPAVQDDFAAALFLNRHGLAGGLLLWAVQAALLAGLLQVAAHNFAAASGARDFRVAWAGRFRCFVLCGGAAFVLGHFLLSWGTNLAIFPIMGQPMSFLSAGGSHLLFFLCPLLAFGAVSAHTLEENLSCRSMSNMKS